MASGVKKARSTWRITSVAITRVMPSRAASIVASVDLPTPVVPPIITTSGRSRRSSRRQARKRRTAALALLGPAAPPRQTPQPSTPTSRGAPSRASLRSTRWASSKERSGDRPVADSVWAIRPLE